MNFNRISPVVLAVAALVVLFVGATSKAFAVQTRTALWSPVEWKSCDAIITPFGSSVNDVYSALRRAAIIGAERSGDVTSGTFALTLRDTRRDETIQLVFDASGRFNGASTWHSTSSKENAQEFVKSITGRLSAQGAKVEARFTDGAELSAVCQGTKVTITVGIDSEVSSRAFISVMSQESASKSNGLTENR